MGKIVIKCTDQANEEQFKKQTEEFFKQKKGTIEVRKSAPNSFKIESREEFQKNYKAWLEYLSTFNIDISQIQLVKEEERSKTSVSIGRITSKVDRVKSSITFESLKADFESFKKSALKPPSSTEVSSLQSHSSTESLSSISSNETVTSDERDILTDIPSTVQEVQPPTDETIIQEVVSSKSPIAPLSHVERKVKPHPGSFPSQLLGSGPQISDLTRLEEIKSQAQELQNRINTLQPKDLLDKKEEILKQNSELLEALNTIEGVRIELKDSIKALVNQNIKLVQIKTSPPPSISPTAVVSLSSSKILEDLVSSIGKKRLYDKALELYEKNIILPQKIVVSETIKNALESIKSNFNFFDSLTANSDFLDLIDDYFDEINPNPLEDDLDVEIEDFNIFHQNTLSYVDKIFTSIVEMIAKDPTDSKLSMKIGDLKIKNRLEIYRNALFDYISYLFSGSVEKKKFNDFVKYYENNLEERVKSERIQELKEPINRISETIEKLKNFIDEQKNPGSKSILTLSDEEKIKKLECLDKVLSEKESNFYAVIEALQSQGINILEINYSDYVKWKELKLGKDNLDLFEFPLRGAGVLEELKYVAQLLNDVNNIINIPGPSQDKAQKIYDQIFKEKEIPLGQLRYSSLYASITKEEFNDLLKNLKIIISENESPREKLIRLLDKEADTEKLSQLLQYGGTIDKKRLDMTGSNIEQFKKIITIFIKDLTKTPTSAELGIDDGLYQIITSSSPSPVSPTADPILEELEEITYQAQRVNEGISKVKESSSQAKYSELSKLQQENDRLLSLIKNEKFRDREISSIQTLLEGNKAQILNLIPPPPPSVTVTNPDDTRPLGTNQSLLKQIQNPPILKKTAKNPPPSTQRSLMDEIKEPRKLRKAAPTSQTPINKHGLFEGGHVDVMLNKASQKELLPVSSSELKKCATITMNNDGSEYKLILYIDKNNKYQLCNDELPPNLIGEPLENDAAVIRACKNFYQEQSCSTVEVQFEPELDLFDFDGGNAKYFEGEILVLSKISYKV